MEEFSYRKNDTHMKDTGWHPLESATYSNYCPHAHRAVQMGVVLKQDKTCDHNTGNWHKHGELSS